MKCLRTLSAAAVLLTVFVLAGPAVLWAGGSREESDTSRGVYVVGEGKIIPPAEIDVGSYIASVDYGYPDPPGELGVTVYSGNAHVPLSGREEILQVGIQARRTPFEELPVLNLAFVFDASGSMSEKHKIEWAKESLAILLGRLRRQDILAVVAFAGGAQVLLPATRVSELAERTALLERVQGVNAEGQTDLAAGLAAGYEQVRAAYRPEYVNRVVLVSDGQGDSEAALELAAGHRKQGISLSTVAVGMNCDSATMKLLSKAGAGSSRFLSSRERMEDLFGEDLDRMVVPIAYDLWITLALSEGVEIIGTWGYDHDVHGSTVRYSLPALHTRDYETILAEIRLPARKLARRETVARVELSYSDRAGNRRAMGPYPLAVEYTDPPLASGGISDPIVLKAGTMLHTAQGLETIGFLYYSSQEYSRTLPRLNRSAQSNTDVAQEERLRGVQSSQRAETQESVQANLQRCLDLSQAIKKQIHDTHLRLGEELFTEELTIAAKYIEILGRELRLPAAVISGLLADE